MKIVIAVLFGLLSTGLCAAQTSDEYKACSSGAATQTALHRCADDELRRADRDLNGAYQRLLSAVRGQPQVTDTIKAMERAWIVYRDAYLEAMYPAPDKRAAYGTMFVVDNSLLRAKLTRDQTAAVMALLAQHGAPKQ